MSHLIPAPGLREGGCSEEQDIRSSPLLIASSSFSALHEPRLDYRLYSRVEFQATAMELGSGVCVRYICILYDAAQPETAELWRFT